MLLTNINEEFVSQAQRGKFYACASGEGRDCGDTPVGKWKRMTKEFEESTPKGKKLPERAKKNHVKNCMCNRCMNAAPNDSDREIDRIAEHFIKTKNMPVTTVNAIVNMIDKVASHMGPGFMKQIRDRLEMREDPFGREKMIPGQEPYTTDERKKRDELISGAAEYDETNSDQRR